MNKFIKANTLGAGANGTVTENGATSYFTIGSALLDQFSKSASYRGRSMETVWNEQALLWAENPDMALKFPFYLRMITRQSNIIGGEKTDKVQRGAGVRDEAFKRLLWIAKYHPDVFYRNLWLLPVVGSWKDLWTLLSYDDASEYLDENKFFEVIAEGVEDKNHKDLVKKYMPRIRSDKRCNTQWAVRTNRLAKHFANAVGWSYKDYRDFKSTGKAHDFQKIICKGLYSKLNWGVIPGKALLNLVSGKFIERHELVDSYFNWVNKQDTIKFNGYPYELGRKVETKRCKLNLVEKLTIDKQFDALISTAKKDNGAINGNVLCALDTSASMGWDTLDKTGTTPFHVCISLGIYFSELNTGAFHNTVAMFDSTTTLKTLTGKTFTDKWNEICRSETAFGSTNFQSVIDCLIETRTNNPDIPLEDYPETLLVVSDMQFNSTVDKKSNYECAMDKLRSVFPEDFVKNFKIIWWNCTSRQTNDFPSTMENSGTYFFSGFDGSVISFLLGGETATNETKKEIPSMTDVINTAFNQEVLCLVK